MQLDHDEFNDFYNKVISSDYLINDYNNYKGISRKIYPKWTGWKILNEYSNLNTEINTINDEKLNVLVKNFYYILFFSTIATETTEKVS